MIKRNNQSFHDNIEIMKRLGASNQEIIRTHCSSIYEHEESFSDCEVNMSELDLTPLFLYKPVFFKDSLEDVREDLLDFRYINNVLYTLKNRHVHVHKNKHATIMDVYNIKEYIAPLLVGECEAVLNKKLGGWLVYKKIKSWEINCLENKNTYWVSPCKNFKIRTEDDGQFTILSPFYDRFSHTESLLTSLLEIYEIPDFHLSYLNGTKRYDLYLKTLEEKVAQHERKS